MLAYHLYTESAKRAEKTNVNLINFYTGAAAATFFGIWGKQCFRTEAADLIVFFKEAIISLEHAE